MHLTKVERDMVSMHMENKKTVTTKIIKNGKMTIIVEKYKNGKIVKTTTRVLDPKEKKNVRKK